MMDTAGELWGRAAVRKALSEPEPEPMTDDLLAEVRDRAGGMTDAGFRRWTLAQPWPRFCAVVQLVAGMTRAELLTMGAVHE